jgi:hypothetical protein
LQELVAPRPPAVDFSSTKQKLSTKRTLQRQITQVSDMPAEALRGTSMSEFSIGEKMGWAARRTTTRPEDGAYCLFGIFDVFMPISYCEGADNAFARLNEEVERRLNPNRKSNIPMYSGLSRRQCSDFNIAGFVPGRGPPPTSEGSRYNCFGELSTVGIHAFSAVMQCKKCRWSIGILWGYEFKTPVHVYGRDVPNETMHQRFQYKQRTWRCFICRDGRELDKAQLKDHLEGNHTYGEICN